MNKRALDGSIRLPKTKAELLEKVDRAYSAYYKIWTTSVVPKLLKMHKCYKDSGELSVGDIVLFARKKRSFLRNG